MDLIAILRRINNVEQPSDFGWKIAIPIFRLPVNASGQPLHVVAEVLSSSEKALCPLASHATPKCLNIHCVSEAQVGASWIILQQTTYTMGLFRLYPIPLYTLFS